MAHYIGKIENVSMHSVGNKAKEEELSLSENLLSLDENLTNILETYFEAAFKPLETFEFFNENSLEYNAVFKICESIFQNPNILHEASKEFSRKLYEVQDHPNIKGGEFYTVYFSGCALNGETVDAIGLFKSENKDVFLKVKHRAGNYSLEPQKGINIRKLDKGCIVFNAKHNEGYVVTVVDNINKSSEARYWVDDFLQIKKKTDEYFHTENALALCQSFINDALPAEFEVSRADQSELLMRSSKFFKENSNFNFDEFSTEVIEQPEVIDVFNAYKTQFENDREISFDDGFDISAPAVKKNSRIFKSVIKLDKNFHIYVHGNPDLIERGVDENGRKYYKVFFDEER